MRLVRVDGYGLPQLRRQVMSSFKEQLSAVRSAYSELVDDYQCFEQMLRQEEPFVPRYVKPVSRQSSVGARSFGGNYTS